MQSSVKAIRALDPKATVGYVMSSHIKHPVTDSEADIEAARKATYDVKDKNSWNNTWWLDPVLKGQYPEQGLRLFGSDMPAGYENDLADMHPPVDFIGMNIYTSAPVRAGKDGEPEEVKWPDGYPRTGVDWQQVVPQSLYWGPRFIHERYQLPVFITENGCSTRDQIFLDGKVHDPQRIDILQPLSARTPPRHRRRRAGEGLLRMVAARQLRMGRRLQTTLRHRLCGLRDSKTHPEGLVPLVSSR